MPLTLINARSAHRLAPPQQTQRQIRQAAPDLLAANTNPCLERPRDNELRADGRSHARHDTNTVGRQPAARRHQTRSRSRYPARAERHHPSSADAGRRTSRLPLAEEVDGSPAAVDSIDHDRPVASRCKALTVGEIENPDLPDTWNAVDKMAKKRGYVDAVLSVTGASAIFTQDIGTDPSDADANGLEHGPVVSGALKQAAREAAIKLCGGDIDQAKALWEKLQGEFDGYMPEAPARTLLLAAEHAAQPTGENQQASSQTDGPAIGGTRTEEPTRRQHTDQQAQAASGGETSPEAPASPQSQGDPNPAPAGANEPNTVPREPNPHGARLRAIANRRGVNDAELANLIRNAVAQGPIPAARARTALPEMLARITEEISEHTIELVEMFHPPSTNTEAATDQTTSVDFGALEPPQAA
jgi:hypothetical protein